MDDETEGSEPGATASMKPSEFSTFVISLGSSVLMSLGHEDPTGAQSMDADLELALDIGRTRRAGDQRDASRRCFKLRAEPGPGVLVAADDRRGRKYGDMGLGQKM